MNKRLILNIMMVALLTFYMVFNIVYQRLMKKHEPEEASIVSVWDSQTIVPSTWQLTRLEIPESTLQSDINEAWTDLNKTVDDATAKTIAFSWQNLKAATINDYQQLPLTGITILAFVAEDSQPLVFRVTEQAEELHFYRMIDQKKFSFPLSLKAQLLPD